MNAIEKLFLNQPLEAQSIIKGLIERQLESNGKDEVVAKDLASYAKFLELHLEINDTCNWEIDAPVITGEKSFSSVEEYLEKDSLYGSFDEAEDDGVRWEDDVSAEGWFSWDDSPKVILQVIGLTDAACDEAKALWKAQVQQKQEERTQEQERDRLARKKAELLKLQAEIAAAEAGA